ncbi:glycoside hydrolase family 70 protein, partial [Leuconostoc citreum]|uniref:glycoside hydrolase family 70 protein n=1 Tax=Leuconostoc citreum TaxID=33964 RepID=UPI0022E00074
IIDKKEPVPESTTNNDSKSVHASGKDIDQQNELNKNTQSAVNKNTATENNKKTQDQNTATTPDTKESNKALSDDQKITVQDDRNIALSKNLVDDKDAISTVITGGRYEQQDGHFVYLDQSGKKVIGLQNIAGKVQYFGDDGIQVKGAFRDIKGNHIYFSANDGNATENVDIVNGNLYGYDAQGKQAKNSFIQDINGNTYYFDANGNKAVGIQEIAGEKYYLDEQGHLRKNYAGIFNNQFMYFDSNTGAGQTAIEYQFQQGLTSQNNIDKVHNSAKSYDEQSFENVDGFLTADSWYRPNDILKDGKTWQPSSEADKRPLLMTWWPDVQTQIAYLNFMTGIGLGTAAKYTSETSQQDLNEAVLNIQAAIEQKISVSKSTEWLREAINSFVKSQSNWNVNTEDKYTDTADVLQAFQGGFLTYQNSDLTPNVNSDWRDRMNRFLFNRDGKFNEKFFSSELLLANDVNNSDPVVQAEQLNWLHYILNFGTITANDENANFDGIRVDAPDNVNADLLQIAKDYFNAVYGVNQNDNVANKHISILEDWNYKDITPLAEMGNPQLTMDASIHDNFVSVLMRNPQFADNMEKFLNSYLIDRKRDYDVEGQTPNYSFVRAHDNSVQEVILDIITKKLGKSVSWGEVTLEQISDALKTYQADQLVADKQFTQFNIPSAYAMMLTNKDTIPRVYYGDMFTDEGQYMSKNTPYHDAIEALLKARVKYVAGGQEMSMVEGHNDLLSSVRFGGNALKPGDIGNQETRTQGIGIIVSNNPNVKLTQKFSLYMGAAHKNQEYRALLQSTDKGLQIYSGDTDVPTMTTDSNGYLNFDVGSIVGVFNPQVAGYLAAWVPKGANESQDARTLDASKIATSNKNSIYHSNAALDSQVIYESFSNFQSMPNNPDEYTNVVIAKNAEIFKSWGITSFEMAPQYRSSEDGTFLDSIINNGYAFTDRYDLGFDKPTKYGTDEDLRNAVRGLHNAGMQVMADWVPDQIYSLPGKEVVQVKRTDAQGELYNNSQLNNLLYVTNTKGGGDFQKKYGGAFLQQLQQDYPDIFKRIQVSTDRTIDPSTKITEWSAKYMNGTNILGRGAYYVLKDWATNKYFNISNTDNMFLPLQLENKESTTGFMSDASGVKYYSTSGYQAKNTFIEDSDNNWYYFDESGYMVRTKNQENPLKNITSSGSKNGLYYFMPNGVELRNGFGQSDNGNTYYFNNLGQMVTNQYVIDAANNVYRLNYDGTMARGLVITEKNDNNNVLQYFATNGVQIKGTYAKDSQGNKYYFDPVTGNNDFSKAATWDGNGNYITIDSDTKNTIGIATDYTAYITSSLREDGLFANAPYGVVTKDQNGNDLKWQYINHTKQYEGQQVQVTRQYTDSKGVSWNLITFAGGDLQGQKLWVDSRALTMTPFKTMNQISFISYANRNDGLFLNAP